MIKNIYVPLKIAQKDIQVADIFIQRGDRIRRKQLLMILKSDNIETPIQSDNNGWVRHIAPQHNQSISPGDLLMILDVMEDNDYRVDPSELNPDTELGENGRRGLEREGEKQFSNEVAAALFNAPQENEGDQQRHGVKQHPFLSNAKEGVPPKMSHAENNHQATDQLAEDASTDPQLANQLNNELKARLNVNPGPSASPTLTRGG